MGNVIFSYFTKFLKRPNGTNDNYYDDKNLKMYAEANGKSASGLYVIAPMVTRINIRFQSLTDSAAKRVLPATFKSGERTFSLQEMIVENEAHGMVLGAALNTCEQGLQRQNRYPDQSSHNQGF